VAVIYRHFPLHDFALPAAKASHCAHLQGKFEEMHDGLYGAANLIGIRPWTTYAVQAGVADTIAFTECLADQDTDALIARDTLAARQLGVSGTPTFLINDLLVRGFFGAQTMDTWVETALQQKSR
jgi:protein-disulfide isomerase